MNPETKRTSHIIIGSILLLTTLLFTGGMVTLLLTKQDLTSVERGSIIVILCIIGFLFLFFGIRSLVIGFKSYKLVKQGRAREAKIVSITDVKDSIIYKELVVSFYGESGQKYDLSVIINLNKAKGLEVGQYIQCFVIGETGYVDTDNIKVIKEKQEEIDFE